jgi:hypothetical protein
VGRWWRRKRLGALALCAGLVSGLAACDAGTPSALNPDESVLVHGRLVGTDGKPVARTRVALYRQPSVGEALGGTFVLLASAGVACLADNAPQVCHGARHTVTGDDGTFSYSMKGSDTYEGSGRNAATFSLSAALPARGDQLTGPDTTETFKIQVADLHVPDVAFWQPQVTYSGTGPTGRLTWTAPAPALGDQPSFEAEFEDPTGNLVWAYPNLQSPATVDARMLEDHDGGIAVHARPHRVGTGTVFNLDYRSPGMIFRGSAGAPLSRQRACFVPVTGQPPVRQRPCRLTDGDIATVFTAQAGCAAQATASPCPQAQVDAPFIDLGASAAIDMVVLHGCNGSCLIDTSSDGEHWAAAGGRQPTDPQNFNGLDAFALPHGTRARYVRTTGSTVRLTEVSVWGPAGQALPPPTEPAPAPPRAISTGGHAANVALSDGQFRLIILLNVFGLLVIGAVVLTLVRRRTTRPAAR